jgi:hypothetical protein
MLELNLARDTALHALRQLRKLDSWWVLRSNSLHLVGGLRLTHSLTLCNSVTHGVCGERILHLVLLLGHRLSSV